MNWFGLILGAMIVILASKPSMIKARKQIRDARLGIIDLTRRRIALSQRLRALARESLGQRLTAGADDTEAGTLDDNIALLKRRVEELEAIDRRILVLDERRGLQETGWIVLVRRARASAPPMEPSGITQLWDEGRYLFVFAIDARKARRKTIVRFTEEGGFQLVEVYPHEGDMTEPPRLNQAVGAA